MPDIYKQTTLEDVIITILAIIVIIVTIGCLYSFFRAIFLFIFSGGKEENKKKGRNSIRFMIIGLILTIVLLFIFPYTLKLMNFEVKEYSARKVFSKVGELIQKTTKFKEFIEKSQKDNEYRGNLYYDLTPDSNYKTSEPSTNGGYDL